MHETSTVESIFGGGGGKSEFYYYRPVFLFSNLFMVENNLKHFKS